MARIVAVGLDGVRGGDELTGWHRPGGLCGELRKGRRRPIQRSTTQRSQSRSWSRKARRELRSAVVTSILDERGLVRRPYRFCIAILKGWASESSNGRPRWKHGNASRKLEEQGGGEPPRSRRGTPKACGECAVPVGDRPTENDGTRTEVRAWGEAEEKRAVAGERRRVREE